MRGVSVTLHERTQTGVDGFNNPVYASSAVTVDNVLPGSPTAEDLTSSIQLYGKRATYVLGIPKGDGHRWEDSEIEFFGRRFRSFGPVEEGVEALVPTPWHRKVRVEEIG